MGKLRHREVDCLQSPDLNVPHSTAFPEGKSSVISPARSPAHPSLPLSQGAMKTIPGHDGLSRGVFPSTAPKVRGWQAAARMPSPPVSPAYRENPLNRRASPPQATVHYQMVLLGKSNLDLACSSSARKVGQRHRVEKEPVEKSA